MSNSDDHKDADHLLDEWGHERVRIQGGGYPSGHDSAGGQHHSDRTFATVSRLNHLIAVDNAVTALPADHQKALEAQYVRRISERDAAKEVGENGIALATWQRMRDRARLDFMWQYRIALWRKGMLDERPISRSEARKMAVGERV